jgi:hypothetical protein
VQLPFATGKSFTVDGLREKLRELFRQEVGAELRAGAALNNVELYRAHFFQLAGRPYRPSVAHSQLGGFAADYLGRKQALAAYVSEQSGATRNLQMTTATLARARCSVCGESVIGQESLRSANGGRELKAANLTASRGAIRCQCVAFLERPFVALEDFRSVVAVS